MGWLWKVVYWLAAWLDRVVSNKRSTFTKSEMLKYAQAASDDAACAERRVLELMEDLDAANEKVAKWEGKYLYPANQTLSHTDLTIEMGLRERRIAELTKELEELRGGYNRLYAATREYIQKTVDVVLNCGADMP